MGTTRLSLETDLDKCINTLANTRAKCMVQIDCKMCDPRRCGQCHTYMNYMYAVRNMPAVDKLSIQNRSESIYLNYINRAESTIGSTFRDKLIFAIKMIVVAIFMIMFTIVPFCELMYNEYVKPHDILSDDIGYSLNPQHDKFIRHLLEKTHAFVTDVNFDNSIDCIDYSITFYHLFLKENVYLPNQIALIHNYNINTGMNHMFVRIQVDGQTYYVEPQARWNSIYLVPVIWGRKYNPLYNYEDYTKYYLKLYDKIRR